LNIIWEIIHLYKNNIWLADFKKYDPGYQNDLCSLNICWVITKLIRQTTCKIKSLFNVYWILGPLLLQIFQLYLWECWYFMQTNEIDLFFWLWCAVKSKYKNSINRQIFNKNIQISHHLVKHLPDSYKIKIHHMSLNRYIGYTFTNL
jgi:hypothetical protein